MEDNQEILNLLMGVAVSESQHRSLRETKFLNELIGFIDKKELLFLMGVNGKPSISFSKEIDGREYEITITGKKKRKEKK